jgi:hypothetical protein
VIFFVVLWEIMLLVGTTFFLWFSFLPMVVSPFECVTGVLPRKPIDLFPLVDKARHNIEADAYARHIRDIHNEIRRKIAITTENYKTHAYLQRRLLYLKEETLWCRSSLNSFLRACTRSFIQEALVPTRFLGKSALMLMSLTY